MIDLPTSPAPASATPVFLDAGTILKGGLGASDVRVNRLGSRFGISVTMPPMKHPATGMLWLSRLLQAQNEGARMIWPQQGFDPGAPGSIKINGAGQAGSTLVVDGATHNYVAREGQFFHIETGGQRFLYMAAEETLFSDTGTASLPIFPMLRFQHLDNDVCEFGAPTIEGFVQGDARQWEWAVANFTSLSFEIHERA